MRISSARVTFSLLALFVGSTLCPLVHAQNQAPQNQTPQNQAQTPPCPNTTASSGTTQNGSSSSISQNARNVENAAKSLGSIFKKKAPPPNSAAAAPCPSAAPSAAPGPSASASGAAAASAQPTSGQPASGAAAAPSQGGSAPWTPPSDSPSAAPAGPLEPAKLPDVVGIHMGMLRQDVPGILLKLHPGNPIQPEGPDTVAGLSFSAQLPGQSAGDNIHVEFTLLPDKQRVYFIERYIRYGQAMTYDNFLAAERQKYGQEIFTDIGGDTKYWLFDEQGHPLPPDKNAQQQSPYGCDPDQASGRMLFLNQVRSYTNGGLPPATFCDSVIVLMVQAGPGPVQSIHTFLEDRALLRREVAVSGEAAKVEGQKKQQQQLKDANQAKPNL